MAAKILTEGGLTVACSKPVRRSIPKKISRCSCGPTILPHRGAGVGGNASENFGEFLAPNGAWNIDGEPYTSAPGANFQWFRSRIVGGRTNHWGRIAFAFLPSISNPIRAMAWATIGPSATKISRRITTKWNPISAFSARRKMFPARPTAFFSPRQAPLHRTDGQESLRQAEYYLHSVASCHLDAPAQRPPALPLLRPVRARLHHRFEFQFQPGPDSSRACKTGKLTLITGAMAREILVGKDGKATGVSYIDKATRTEKRINARAIVVAASACESARLLLNSKSSAVSRMAWQTPRGRRRYLIDSVGSDG